MRVDVKKLVEKSREEVLKYLKLQHEERVKGFQFENPNFWFLYLNRILRKIGYYLIPYKTYRNLRDVAYNPYSKLMAFSTLIQLENSPQRWSELFNVLSDEYSKKILEWFIKIRVAYSMIGDSAFYVFPLNNELKNLRDRFIESCMIKKKITIDNVKIKILPFQCRTLSLLLIFDQYNYKNIVTISENDIVIDIGAMSGETSLFFALKALNGKVYAFEPSPKNYEYLMKTLKMNPKIQNVIPQKIALGDRSGKVQIVGSGGIAHVGKENGVDVEMLTLDEFVERNKIERVDFIKMDVEGFEMNILKGAVNTIKRFKPKLAISIYHPENNPADMVDFLKNLNPDYKFFLDHHLDLSIMETVLYVVSTDI